MADLVRGNIDAKGKNIGYSSAEDLCHGSSSRGLGIHDLGAVSQRSERGERSHPGSIARLD